MQLKRPLSFHTILPITLLNKELLQLIRLSLTHQCFHHPLEQLLRYHIRLLDERLGHIRVLCLLLFQQDVQTSLEFFLSRVVLQPQLSSEELLWSLQHFGDVFLRLASCNELVRLFDRVELVENLLDVLSDFDLRVEVGGFDLLSG